MMRVQAELRTVVAEAAARSHRERLTASVAKLELALCTREMHATTPTTIGTFTFFQSQKKLVIDTDMAKL